MSRVMEPLSVGRVIGDVIDIFSPSVRMNVTYNSNIHVANGHELKPSMVISKPRVDIGGDDMRFAYTLVSCSVTYSSIASLYLYVCVCVTVYCTQDIFSIQLLLT